MATSAMPLAGFSDSSSMLASIPADIMGDFATPPEPITVDAPDTPIDDAPVDDTPADEPLSDSEPADSSIVPDPDLPDEPIAAAPDPAAQPEELPEGVTRGKDRSGKEKMFLDPKRYETVYGNHKLVQQITEKLGGQPLDLATVDLMQRSMLAQERLFTNVTSADPVLQGDVTKFMFREMLNAREAGEVGSDPTVPFTESLYATLRDGWTDESGQKYEAPDAYAQLRYMAAKDLIGEMFQNAAAKGNNDLFAGAQQMACELLGIGPKPEGMTGQQYVAQIREAATAAGVPFYLPTEMQDMTRGPDPQTLLQQENARLKEQLNGRSQTSAAEQFRNWDKTHKQSVSQAVDTEAVLPSIASAQEAWKQWPDDYAREVLDPLKRAVQTAIGGDQALNTRIVELRGRIQRATSEQARNQIGQEIQQLIVNRGRLAAEQAKGPILKRAADMLKLRSQQTTGRREAGQTRTAPRGTSTPVNRSLAPEMPQFKGGMYDRDTAMQQATRMLAALNR